MDITPRNENQQKAGESPVEPVAAPKPEPSQSQANNIPQRIVMTLCALIGLSLLAGIIAWFLVPDSLKKSAATKKDIPLLRVGTFSDSLDIFYPNENVQDTGALDINLQIYEGLVGYQNETKVVPLLASSWTNPDAKTWVFKLKPNVTFHNGSTMTADDVKYSLELFKGTENALGNLYASTIESVEVESADTVRITTTNPDPVLINKLVFLFVVDDAEKGREGILSGSGPYRVKPGTTPSNMLTQLAAYDSYHGGHVYTRELEFKYYEEGAQMVADFKAGKLDIGGPLLQEDIDLVAGSGLDSFKTELLNIGHLAFNLNNTSSPVANQKFREGLYLALDPQPFIELRGVEGEPASQIVPRDVPGYNPEIKRPARDLERAKQLFAEAGYPNGATIKFTYFAPPAKVFAEELATQLAPLGITVTGELKDLESLYADSSIEFYYLNVGTDIFDASDVMASTFQTSHYRKAAVDELLQKASETINQAERIKYLQAASKIIMDDVAWIPLFSVSNKWVISQSVVVDRDVKTAGLGIFFWQAHTE